MKRKADDVVDEKKPARKRSKIALADDEAKKRFRAGLFDEAELASYTKQYGTSKPYKHAVIDQLVDDTLLRAVRDEIRENISFTSKETDIYKIQQSGDLANLDGLEDTALAQLPSLLALRDALYSDAFRTYVSTITGCGALSGRKTDMAINVYTPGCYLLCHDDVIGSRKVSYILYLTDPDKPWQAEWGGALRLYPVEAREGVDGMVARTPSPQFSKVIPPAWNQLSFFAVQPGESFHDVEEVYHAANAAALEKDGGRIRMAISGWFHIPQEGEPGFEPGAEEKLALNSGLMQLQGNPDQYDQPAANPVQVVESDSQGDELEASFSQADLEFLLRYLSPTYLTPDMLEQVATHFEENFSIQLGGILSERFGARLRAHIASLEVESLPNDIDEVEKTSEWRVARPPHKHRYLYMLPSGPDQLRRSRDESPLTDLLDTFLPSRQFRRWLQLATRCIATSHDIVARRFRRGEDYTLATGHSGNACLEVNLGITPSSGWGLDEEPEADDDDNTDTDPEIVDRSNGNETTIHRANGTSSDISQHGKSNGKRKGKEKATQNGHPTDEKDADGDDFGGHEVYMAGDDEDAHEDAAVYKTASDDDNILFFQGPAWNNLTMVLRDSGTLRFVKYLSRRAPGDRFDIVATYQVEEEERDGQDDDEATTIALGESDAEEEFHGFSDEDEEEEESD